MLKLLRKRWWKYLSVALVLFALLAGLYFPLGPGITAVSPEKATEGTAVTLNITTYNTNFDAGDRPKVILQHDSTSLCAETVTVVTPRTLSATFALPADAGIQGSKMFNVLVDDASSGTFFMRGGVTVLGKGEGSTQYNCLDGFERSAARGFTIPNREILYESIRNLFYHVPMWFAMVFMLIFSFGSSIAYLAKGNPLYDIFAREAALVGLLYGALGIVTGMVWATFTWGAPWVNDPKLNGAAVGMLIYLAYFVLRNSLTQREQRARVSAVYSIFAFIIYIVFIFVLPRITDSLHPGNGGNPAFSNYDLDNSLRPIFYSAVLGFTGFGYWMMSILIRLALVREQLDEQTEEPYYESLVS